MDHLKDRTSSFRSAGCSSFASNGQPTQSPVPSQLTLNPLERSFTRGLFVPVSSPDCPDARGFVHLYRAGQAVPAADSLSSKIETSSELEPSKCNTYCIPEIPLYVSPSDLLSFIGLDGREIISHIRLLRTENKSMYMALLKFRDSVLAQKWKSELAGASFSSLRPETCQLFAIHSVTFQSLDGDSSPTSFPSVAGDPFIPGYEEERPTKQVDLLATNNHNFSPDAGTQLSNPEGVADVPTCPVCLERMDDETVGVVTILCQHTFHSGCLEKWRGNTCPVCRYTQDQSIDLKSRLGDLADHECNVCQSSANLWICLICGNIGCGRYDSAHAFSHYESTGHTFAMDIATQAVWDYVGDGYVHRLIHNNDVDELAGEEFSGTKGLSQNNLTALGADMVPREKVEAMSSEYTYLLSSQLYTQRLFFEDQARALREGFDKSRAEFQELLELKNQLSKEVDKLRLSNSTLLEEQAASVKKMEKLSKRAEDADNRARQSEKQMNEEQVMNRMFLKKVQHLTAKVEEANKERDQLLKKNQELQEEVRDLNFFISSQDQIRNMTTEEQEELAQGSLAVGPSRGGNKKKKKPKKKGIPADVLATLQANVGPAMGSNGQEKSDGNAEFQGA